jgi:uncharacterized protein YecA (UPF0149 family)
MNSKKVKTNDSANENEHVHGPDCQHDHHQKSQPLINHEPKIGRNDPCSCGSLKKFKKCCGK